MVLLLCIQNSLVPGSDGQKGTLIGEKIASGATTPRSSSPIPTLERRVRPEEEVWASLTSNSRKGYSTEVPNAARHQPASVHNKSTTHTDSTHTTHTQIAHTRRTQIAHTRHTQTFARDTLPSEFNKDTAQEDVRLNSQKKTQGIKNGQFKDAQLKVLLCTSQTSRL